MGTLKVVKLRVGTGTGKQTQMLYKHPGKTQLQDSSYECKVFPIKEVEEALKDGWYLTSPEALKNSTGPAPKPVMNALEENKKLIKQQDELLKNQKTLEDKKTEFEKEKKRFEFEKKNQKGAQKAG